MSGECVTCSWMDQESQKRWAKAEDIGDENWIPHFNSRYAFCTHENHRRRPTADQVAGRHMDVVKLTDPPWKSCRECRRFYGDDTPCPYWKERQNEN